MSLTVKDLERMQQQIPDYPMELVDGEIIVMSPSGYELDEIALEIAAQFRDWVRPRKLGRVTASSAGFVLPNADVRAPDASFVKAERLKRTIEGFAQLVPDLMFEVKSKTDTLKKLRNKIQEFLNLGTQVGVLVDPRTEIVEVYRSGSEVLTLGNGDVLTVPELLPGWATVYTQVLWFVAESSKPPKSPKIGGLPESSKSPNFGGLAPAASKKRGREDYNRSEKTYVHTVAQWEMAISGIWAPEFE